MPHLCSRKSNGTREHTGALAITPNPRNTLVALNDLFDISILTSACREGTIHKMRRLENFPSSVGTNLYLSFKMTGSKSLLTYSPLIFTTSAISCAQRSWMCVNATFHHLFPAERSEEIPRIRTYAGVNL